MIFTNHFNSTHAPYCQVSGKSTPSKISFMQSLPFSVNCFDLKCPPLISSHCGTHLPISWATKTPSLSTKCTGLSPVNLAQTIRRFWQIVMHTPLCIVKPFSVVQNSKIFFFRTGTAKILQVISNANTSFAISVFMIFSVFVCWNSEFFAGLWLSHRKVTTVGLAWIVDFLWIWKTSA